MKSAHHHSDHLAARAFIAFLILVIAFAVFLIFQIKSETIILNGDFQKFMVLVIIGFGLLLGLLYLTNNSHHTPSKKKKR